ncbi:MAG TPA: hypothetical protein VFB60_09460 [Ktedonobacteraceae bacterium]|nr:hypothetical protein [Ktedonobacteraceae bacterium]
MNIDAGVKPRIAGDGGGCVGGAGGGGIGVGTGVGVAVGVGVGVGVSVGVATMAAEVGVEADVAGVEPPQAARILQARITLRIVIMILMRRPRRTDGHEVRAVGGKEVERTISILS